MQYVGMLDQENDNQFYLYFNETISGRSTVTYLFKRDPLYLTLVFEETLEQHDQHFAL